MLRFKDEAEYNAWVAGTRLAAPATGAAAPAPTPKARQHRPAPRPTVTPAQAAAAARLIVRVVFFLLRAGGWTLLFSLRLITAVMQAVLATLLLINVAGRIGHGRCGGH